MSKFFQLLQSNPILGFSGIVASILGFIIGIPLTIYLYRRGNKKRGLTYKVNSVRTPIVRASAASRLSVLYNGQEINSDITAAHVAIWNQGRESIRHAHILRPLAIETANHAPILEATIQKVTDDVIGLRLDESKCAEGRLGVSWEILEEHDGGIVQIIYAGQPDLQITAHAISEGQRSIIDCSQVLPVRPGVAKAERAVYLMLFFLFIPGIMFELFSTLGPLFQIFPFTGSTPPSVQEVVAISLGTIFGVVFLSAMLRMLRMVKPPFEF